MKQTMNDQLLLAIRMLEIRQRSIEEKLDVISKILVARMDRENGFSPERAMTVLGIKDKRTFEIHAKKIKHRGDRFFEKDLSKIRDSIENAKRRPHLKKLNFTR